MENEDDLNFDFIKAFPGINVPLKETLRKEIDATNKYTDDFFENYKTEFKNIVRIKKPYIVNEGVYVEEHYFDAKNDEELMEQLCLLDCETLLIYSIKKLDVPYVYENDEYLEAVIIGNVNVKIYHYCVRLIEVN